MLKTVLKYAADNNACKVVSVQIRVGAMRDFLEDWMQRYFDHLSKGTIAEGAKIEVERIPMQLRCNDCSNTYRADIMPESFQCPECGSEKIDLVAGNEFLIESIGVI